MLNLIINAVSFATLINAIQDIQETCIHKTNKTIVKESFLDVLKNVAECNEANSLFIKIATMLLNNYSLNSNELNDLKNIFEIKYNIKIPETIRTQKELKLFLIIIGNKQH